MTTQSWSAVIDQTTDAGFRAWGSDYSAKFSAIGLVQAADTGQVNWTTVVRPATGVAAGYEIWRFNDTLHTAFPIYIKIEYGSGGSSSIPSLWITVGTGSNGAGTITGQTSTRRQIAMTAIDSTSVAYPNYFCCVDGFLGIVPRVGASAGTGGACSFTVTRLSNDDGTPNGDGFIVTAAIYNGNGGTIAHTWWQVVRTAAPAMTLGADGLGLYGLWPQTLRTPTAAEDGSLQLIPFWVAAKKVQQVFSMCGVDVSELPQGTTFSAKVKGTVARTFISVGSGLGFGGTGNGTGRTAMLWE